MKNYSRRERRLCKNKLDDEFVLFVIDDILALHRFAEF